MVTGMSAWDKVESLVNGGVCDSDDEAVTMLYDMGEINEDQHAEMLSDEECERIYG